MSTKTKILYVDDESINVFLFKIAFKDHFDVVGAESGREGLLILADNPDIKIVITDLNMPLMNGFEFIKQSQSEREGIRYYLLTGYEMSSEIQEALDAGLIIKYFGKPFDKEAIISEVQKH